MKKNKHYKRTLKKINQSFKARTMLVDIETHPNIIYYSQEPTRRISGPKLNIQRVPITREHIRTWVETYFDSNY